VQELTVKQYITSDNDGYTLCIPVNEQFEGVLVESVTMYVAKDADAGDGDLAVNWSAEGLQNTGGGDMGSLIMRGWEDEVGRVMGEFYWEHGYDGRLQEILVAAGFPVAAAEAVGGSEWGMQDEGRASYDAPEIANAVRAAMQ
jgi:hypothetical protein